MFSARFSTRLGIAALIAGALALPAGCKSYTSGVGPDCATTVTSGTSPAPGALTLTGQFYANETVILSYDLNGQTATVRGTPNTTRTSLTLTGLPSGQRSYELIVSCQGGERDYGSRGYTVL